MEEDLCDVIGVGEHLKLPRRNQPHDDEEVMLSKEIKEAFGFTKENFKKLVEIFGADLETSSKIDIAVPPEEKLLILLDFLCTNSPQRSVSSQKYSAWCK